MDENTEKDYNTQRNKLIMPEYGRNVQRMIEFTAEVKDVEKRNTMAQAIVGLMGQMNPHLRNVEEFKHKLWDHIYMISDGKLDVDSPYPLPDLEVIKHHRPEHVGYPGNKIKYMHYGKNVELLIESARKMEDKEKQKAFSECIGNYMKLVYQNWNKEVVSDETIKQDILALSDNELTLDDNVNLDLLAQSSKTKRRPSKKYGGSNGQSHGGHHKRRSNKKRS